MTMVPLKVRFHNFHEKAGIPNKIQIISSIMYEMVSMSKIQS